MSIDRQELQTKLQTVTPALSSSDLAPLLNHYLFTGKRLISYNDRIALSVPLETEFKGALPSKLLEHVSIAVYAKNAVITTNSDGRAKLQMGKSQSHLNFKTEAEFTEQFQMPAAPKPSEGVLANKEFFTAIDNCLQSIGGQATTNDQLGITLIPDGRDVRMYSTDRRTISYAKLPLPQIGLKDRIIMPAEFCRQMLAFKDAERKQMVVRKDHILFMADDTLLFGRLLRSDSPLDFEKVIQRVMPANFPKGMAKWDSKGTQRGRLKAALDHAVITAGKDGKTNISIKDNVVHLEAKSSFVGEDFNDRVALTSHPNVEVAVNASLITKVYDNYESVLLTTKCAIMANGVDGLYIIAASS